jgi:hypothetical protein
MRTAFCLVLALGALVPSASNALDLDETVWSHAASRAGLDDPVLLYAIALTESGRNTAPGLMQPWPWTLHVPGEGALFFETQEAMLGTLAGKRPADRVDVGPMQVNTAFHMDKVASITALADFETNVHVGAQVLRACLDRHDGLEAAVGCYHSGTPWRARQYASTVLAFYDGLRSLRASP